MLSLPCSYDGNYFSLFPQNALPLVGVVINDVLVEQVAAGGYNSSAYYTDFVAFSTPNEDLEEFSGEGADGDSAAQHSVQVCLASVQGAPYLNTLQVLPVVSTAVMGQNPMANAPERPSFFLWLHFNRPWICRGCGLCQGIFDALQPLLSQRTCFFLPAVMCVADRTPKPTLLPTQERGWYSRRGAALTVVAVRSWAQRTTETPDTAPGLRMFQPLPTWTPGRQSRLPTRSTYPPATPPSAFPRPSSSPRAR